MSGDHLLADTDIEDALSEAYVWAVATHAGYAISKKNFDRDSVDVTIEGGADFRPKIDCQLKATINLKDDGKDHFKFPCPVKNYNKLVIETQTPRILVVMALPTNKENWLNLSENELILRNAAYWISLKGNKITENKDNITIDIPKANHLTVPALQELMNKSRTGFL